MATLTDIARESGFSIAAVSRVLNPRPGVKRKVSEESAARILETARNLQYRPNRQASFLKKGKSATILCFLPDVPYGLTADLMFGISEVACHENFAVNFLYGSSPEDFRRFLEEANASRNSGILSYPPHRMPPVLEQEVRQYCQHGGRILFLNVPSNSPEGGRMSEEFAGVPQLNVDDYFGGSLIARHLLECDCQKFYYLSSEPQYYFQRREGFLRTLEQEGREAVRVRELPWDDLLGHPRRKIGIFAGHDLEATQALLELTRRNFEFGREVFLAGFDDLFLSGRIHPTLTTIHQPMRRIGAVAVKKLIRMILGHEEDSETIRPYLIIRETTRGPHPGDNPEILTG